MAKVEKTSKINGYLNTAIILGSVVFILFPLFQFHESKYWYNYGNAIITLTLFAAASAWVLYATFQLKERLKYLLVFLLLLLIFFLHTCIVAMLTPIFSFIYLSYFGEYLCNKAPVFFLQNFNVNGLESICAVLKP